MNVFNQKQLAMLLMCMGALPFIVGLLVYFTSPDYIAVLFSDPRGHLILGVSGFWMLIGVGVYFWLRSSNPQSLDRMGGLGSGGLDRGGGWGAGIARGCHTTIRCAPGRRRAHRARG